MIVGDFLDTVLKTLAPVSYTHLDVYKRQALFRCFCCRLEAAVVLLRIAKRLLDPI